MADEQGVKEDAGLAVRTAGEALHVRRVFGESYEHDGVLVIPVAKLVGGSGMGFGSGALGDTSTSDPPGAGMPPGAGSGEGSGGGGGFGLRAKPLGVYRVTGEHVTWHPAIDINRAIIGAQLLGAITVAAAAWVLRRRRRGTERRHRPRMPTSPERSARAMTANLVRPSNRIIAGVCAGLAHRLAVSPTLVRVLDVLTRPTTHGSARRASFVGQFRVGSSLLAASDKGASVQKT